MALALTLVIVAAEIDLSVASVLALSSALMAVAVEQRAAARADHAHLPRASARCAAPSTACSSRWLGLPSLAVTIGTLALFRGLAFVVIGDESVTDFPTDLDGPRVRQLRRHVRPEHDGAVRHPRRRLRRAAARARRSGARSTPSAPTRRPRGSPGLPVRRIKLILFVAVRAWSPALAGIVISLRNSTAAANVGQGFELTAITAVLLGGVSIFGGRGTIVGVILALLLLGGIQKALLLSESISSYWIQIVTGALLIGSVLGPNIARRVREARRRAGKSTTGGHTHDRPYPRALRVLVAALALLLAALAFAACGETQDDQEPSSGGGRGDRRPPRARRIRTRRSRRG